MTNLPTSSRDAIVPDSHPKSKLFWILSVASVILVFWFIGFLSPYLNFNSPAYVKQLTAYKEGSDGIAIYFALADERGSVIAASGQVTLVVVETYLDKNWLGQEKEYERKLFQNVSHVDRFDFQNLEIGLAAFSRRMLVFPIGRIPYSRFSTKPSKRVGKVRVVFIPDADNSKPLNAEEEISF